MMKPITAQLRTLLVDDNSTNLRILERTLRHHFSHLVNYSKIVKASGGLAALNACCEQSFELILLDIDMPGMSGVQVAQSIRKTDVDTIIIACTTSDSAEARKTYADAGMDGCVSKPLDLREVNNAIIHALRTRKYLELFQEMNTPDALDRHLVHRGSLPDATLDRSRKHLVAPRSMSSPYIETVAQVENISQSSTSEVETSSPCGQESEDEHEDCISLTDDSDVSSNHSVTIRTRTASISFSSCACNGGRRVRRPRFARTVSAESTNSDNVFEDSLSTNALEASNRASHVACM